MRLPKNILSGNYMKPRIFLCETNKEKICELNTTNTKGSFKFNSYSELSFEVGRTYNDAIDGKTKVNPYYDKIEALRLVYLEGFGYFELQAPELISDGIKEAKSCTTYSLEYTLSQKYLEDFYINTGEVNSVEVINASSENNIVPVTLYNQSNPKLSLLHLILEKIYGWEIGHVDPQLKTLSRQFEVDRESVYDFLINEICEKFNCYVVFNTINNTINVYAESPTVKFIGDGSTNTFKIGNSDNTFSEVKTVSIDGYKTTQWTYGIVAGVGTLILEDTPVSGAMIEVVGVDSTWETDVFVTFDNLSQEINVNYNADDIKTVLTVTYGEDGDIREVNFGLPYITDLSYYYTVDWMGQDLYDAYTAYLEKSNSLQSEYTKNSQEMLEIANLIDFEENRLSLEYSIVQSVNETTVGTYYVRSGTAPNYYYKEVSLPAEYNTNITYYSPDTTNLTEEKVSNLFTVLKKYFNSEEDWESELDKLATDFEFIDEYTLENLHSDLKEATDIRWKNLAVSKFLKEMWNEIGRTPLRMLYYDSYKQIQITNIEAGWSQRSNENYWYYYPVVIMLTSLEFAISERDSKIKGYQEQYNSFQNANAEINNDLLMENNFTEGQLVRLSAFLREDELQLDDIVETSQDSLADSFKVKQDAMESGQIELQKRCQPQLNFSMSMANIYALPEFEPIIDQFQLGKIIKVGLRSDYIKQSRLLQVDIGLDDFSDFSVEFGELTNLRNQSDIHADLLKKAIQAGKSVATNASYWTKGSDQATSTELKIQKGLLDAATAIKSIDGSQEVSIDKYGIHLRKKKENSEEYDVKQGWIVNNQFLYSDDAFESTKSIFGEYKIPTQINKETGKMGYETYWGLLAEAVIAGYIEGSRIRGGTIQIGEQEDGTYAFEVHSDGSVTMNGGSKISGYTTESYVNELKNTAIIISDTQPDTANDGQMWLNTATDPYTLMIFNNGEWVYFEQQDGGKIHTLRPDVYSAGDIWILGLGETYGKYGEGSILKANDNLDWVDAVPSITTTISNVKESFKWDNNGIQVMKRVTDSNGNITNPFYVNIDSTRMGFHSVEYNSDASIKEDVEVVHIGNNSATIQNATFEGAGGTKFKNSSTFEQPISMVKPDTTTGFMWQVENMPGQFADGSLSLVVKS